MANASDYFESIVAHKYFIDETVYMAFFTQDDGLDDGIITSEVMDYFQYREAIHFKEGTAGALTNANVFQLPYPTGTSIITHFAIIDSPVFGEGNVLIHSAMTPNKTISPSQTLGYDVGGLTLDIL